MNQSEYRDSTQTGHRSQEQTYCVPSKRGEKTDDDHLDTCLAPIADCEPGLCGACYKQNDRGDDYRRPDSFLDWKEEE